MCGIAGIANFSGRPGPEEATIRRMAATLRHRGPDDTATEVLGSVGFGIQRLAVIDVEGGRQPVANEDGSVRVIFNGEIYNFRELRERLTAAGHRFASRSDTEVIVHAYEEYGREFPEHLNGMFAIALHDVHAARLMLVRDPIGIKPLFYAIDAERIVWGSEIKALLASGLIARDIDVDSLAEFLTWEYVPCPGTLFQTVRKLEPGRILDVDLNRGSGDLMAFWRLPPPKEAEGPSDAEWEERIEEQICRSTASQLVSDVPLGAFLSGGVDSSLIVSATGPVKTFSIGFDDPAYNELPWARQVADHLGVPHVQEIISSDVADLFDHLITFLDDPIGDFSIFPTFLVSRLAREDVTVVLSGDGGDELFGGYETYSAQLLSERYARVPRGLRKGVVEPLVRSVKPTANRKGAVNLSKRFVEGAALPEELGHARWRRFAGDEELERLLTSETNRMRRRDPAHHITQLFRDAGSRSAVDRCLYVDLCSYLPDNILTKVDRMSMAVSLEARVPYLDRDLVSLAFELPDHLKVTPRRRKVLLKRIASRRLPPEIAARPKKGFSIPIKNWLKTQFRPIMEEQLDEKRIVEDGLLNAKAVSRMKEEHLRGSANHSHLLWSLIVFQAWKKRWADAAVPEQAR